MTASVSFTKSTHFHFNKRCYFYEVQATIRGVATGVYRGYIGIYTHPKSVHLKFYGVFFLLPMRQTNNRLQLVKAIGITICRISY